MLNVLSSPSSPFRWQRTQYSPIARQLDIVRTASQLLFYTSLDHLLPTRSQRLRQRRAHWLLNQLLNLGPTFIKIGQTLSTRADLLPVEYVEALSQLQDRVPSFDADDVHAILEAELGKPVYALFREFEPTPIAAASLGQVHKARLWSGETVVVKVQRPGLESLFSLDCQVLRRLIRTCDRYLPWTRRYNLADIHHEFEQILHNEIDYLQEAQNADRFRQNFSDHPQVVIPKTYPHYTTKRVLTMEYVPGIKIDDRKTLELSGLDVQQINRLGVCAYLKQLLQDGFFQADPHPGNMAVTPDGKLVFYDFGMMAEVQSLDREQMVQTFFAVLRKDADQVIDTLTCMGLLTPMDDRAPLRRVTNFLLEQFTDKPLAIQDLQQVSREVYTLFEQQPFRLPAKMTFILKAITTLDGIARTLDPQYSLLKCAQPFVKTLATQDQRPSIRFLAQQAVEWVRYKLSNPRSLTRLKELEARLEQAELQAQLRDRAAQRAIHQLKLVFKGGVATCVAVASGITGGILVNQAIPLGAFLAFGLCGLSLMIGLSAIARLIFQARLHQIGQ